MCIWRELSDFEMMVLCTCLRISASLRVIQEFQSDLPFIFFHLINSQVFCHKKMVCNLFLIESLTKSPQMFVVVGS